MTKKILSIGLAAALTMSMATVAIASASAVSATEHFDGSDYETNKYYFYMPDSWYNAYSTSAGIYWWSGDGAPESWAGYAADSTDVDNLYSCNVPSNVSTIIWNNTVDGGDDPEDPIKNCAAQTVNIPSEYYEAGDSDLYPDGLFTPDGEAKEDFNNMIYVTDAEKTVISTDPINEGTITAGGEWFYYYGDGKYGDQPTYELALENGGYYNQKMCTPGTTPKITGDVDPTTVPTTEPTTATEATTTATEATTEAPTEAPTDVP